MLLTIGQGFGPQFQVLPSEDSPPPELDITGFTYNSNTLDTNTDASRGFCLNSDGTKLYAVNFTDGTIDEYSFGTVGDITSVTATSETLNVSTPFTQVYDVALSSDDKELYVVGPSSDVVRQYSLSTASDLSTATYSGNQLDLTINMGGTVQGKGIAIVDGDTKLYVTNDSDEKIYQYNLSSARDLSTATYSAVSIATARGFTMYMNEAGTKVLINSIGEDLVYQYSMSTPYDLSTLSQDTTVSTVSEVTANWGSIPSVDNSKLFVCGTSFDFYEYA